MKTSGYKKKNKYNIEYPSQPSALRPVPHSAETPIPVFVQLPSFDDLNPDEELSDSHDVDFEIEDVSAHEGSMSWRIWHGIWDCQKRLQNS